MRFILAALSAAENCFHKTYFWKIQLPTVISHPFAQSVGGFGVCVINHQLVVVALGLSSPVSQAQAHTH